MENDSVKLKIKGEGSFGVSGLFFVGLIVLSLGIVLGFVADNFKGVGFDGFFGIWMWVLSFGLVVGGLLATILGLIRKKSGFLITIVFLIVLTAAIFISFLIPSYGSALKFLFVWY